MTFDRMERWTEETQLRALLLIGEGVDPATIALELGVVEDLVRGLIAAGVTIYGKVVALGDNDAFPGEAVVTLLVSREEAMKIGGAGMMTQDVMGTFRIAKPSPRIVRTGTDLGPLPNLLVSPGEWGELRQAALEHAGERLATLVDSLQRANGGVWGAEWYRGAP